MKKIKVQKITCIVLVAAISLTVLWGSFYKKNQVNEKYNDGITQIDLNTIYLNSSGVQVDFYDVIIGKQEEVRKLIVSEQEATVSINLTDRLIEILDVSFLKKTQKVSYTGNAYFVVDLDCLTRDDVIVDKNSKMVTIFINHAYLQTVEIDPNKIMIDDVKEGLLTWGDIKLTVSDYNAIEKELCNQMVANINTAYHAQEADDYAIRRVKEIYEPVVKAIDTEYEVRVEFK